MKYVLSFCLLLSSAHLLSAQFQKVEWTASLEKGAEDEYVLVLTGIIESGWYLYSQQIEEGGPIPTKIQLEDLDGLETIGKVEESGHKVEGYDKVFMMDITKYKEEVTFKQTVKLPSGTEYLSGTVEFMTCDDEQCLPPTEVEFTAAIENK